MVARDALILLAPQWDDHHTTRHGGYNGGTYTHMQDWGDLYAELLRYKLSNRQVCASKNTVVMEGPRVKAKWLKKRFSNPFSTDTTEMLVQQYAWFYILGMLGGMLFMDKSRDWLSILYLQFFNPISNRKNYS